MAQNKTPAGIITSRAIRSSPSRLMTAKASTAAASTRDRLRSKLLEIAPGYDAYEKRTTRQIPLVILQPINESK